eukprot:scaffold91826_cov112-Phaeocystis_antarctica.AAC.1
MWPAEGSPAAAQTLHLALDCSTTTTSAAAPRGSLRRSGRDSGSPPCLASHIRFRRRCSSSLCRSRFSSATSAATSLALKLGEG